jgi:oxalate decarboxylase
MKKTSVHVTSLAKQPPHLETAGGTITQVDASVFPILERLSIRRLVLKPRGMREPHWTPTATSSPIACAARRW